MWFMIMVYDDYMWSMIMVYDGYMWFMMVVLWPKQMWYVYPWCLDQTVSLNSCGRKRKKLQVCLINELPMRYDLNLFQFILDLMEVM